MPERYESWVQTYLDEYIDRKYNSIVKIFYLYVYLFLLKIQLKINYHQPIPGG